MRLFTRDSFLHFLALLAAVAACVILAGCPPTPPSPSTNYRTDYRLVFPVVAAGPASIDGVANETVWASGFHFVMEDGGAFPAAAFDGVADASFLYIHAKVEDANFSDTDVVVIGLNPDNTAGNYRRIHVFPCKPTGSCPANGSGLSPTVEYWTGSFAGTYTWTSVPAAGAGIIAASSTFTDPMDASNKSWEVEVKIPRGAPFNFANTNFFGLFFDVARTDPNVGINGEAVQYTWPPNEFIGSVDENNILTELESGTLMPSAWGNATLSSVFGNGVTISSNDIRTNHPTNDALIRLNDPNIFYGTASNYSSSGGTLVTAHAVSATFKIANFGLPSLGSFANVPVGGNPTAAVDISPTAANVFETGIWNLTAQQKVDYGANLHQCIRVDLSSTDPSTVFVNPSAARNMDFVATSSPFRATAAVATKGYEPRRGERALAFTLRERFVNFDSRFKWTSKIDNATRVADHIYHAEAAPGADHNLVITVEPPSMKIPSESVRIAAGTGGTARPPVKLAVKPDEVLTFIASGAIAIDGQPVTAAGVLLGKRRGDSKLKYGGSALIGAVLGSFDEFKETAFVIGNASTIKVPRGASVLHLKINDDPDQYSKQQGEGYSFQVVRTTVEPWMLTSNPELGRAVRGGDVFVNLGANLPTWVMRGERDTGRFIRIGKSKFRVYQSVGSFGYMVKSIR